MLYQRQIQIPEDMDLQSLFGDFDSNLKLIEKALEVAVTGRDNVIKISGEEENVDKCGEVINILMEVISRRENIDEKLL